MIIAHAIYSKFRLKTYYVPRVCRAFKRISMHLKRPGTKCLDTLVLFDAVQKRWRPLEFVLQRLLRRTSGRGHNVNRTAHVFLQCTRPVRVDRSNARNVVGGVAQAVLGRRHD